MTDASRGTPTPSWVGALFVTFVMQTTVAFLSRALPVVGPVLTDAAGVPSAWIGHLSAVASAGTVWFLLGGNGLLPRFGPVRMLQAGTLLAAAAVVLSIWGTWPALLLASFLIGIGYGPSPPAGSDILARHAPARHRALVFSVKQSGVPLGGALVGLMIPPLLLAFDLTLALLAVAAIAAATVLLVQPLRAGIDAERDATRPVRLSAFVSPRGLAEPFAAMRLSPVLPLLSCAGACFAMVQGILFAFFVTYTTEVVGLTFTDAGLAFAVLQGVGIVSRIAMGWIADRLGSALLTLVFLAGTSTVATAALAVLDGGWPFWLLLPVCALIGIAMASWNGVILAEVAHHAPRGKAGPATAGATFFVFMGYVAGPSGFALLVQLIGDWRLAFFLATALPAGAGVLLFVGMRRAR
jgi:MFS family permease